MADLMTLEDVRDWHRQWAMGRIGNADGFAHTEAADAIDAAIKQREQDANNPLKGWIFDKVTMGRGDERKPKFGEWMRGVWASESNPLRDGMYVETRRRTGRFNPGTWYRLTDGHGRFWEYEAKATVFLPPNTRNQPGKPR